MTPERIAEHWRSRIADIRQGGNYTLEEHAKLCDLAEEALIRREIMKTLHCDITLEEAKALAKTQDETLRIIRERGL